MHCWMFRYEAMGFGAWWQAPTPDDLDCVAYGCDLSDTAGAWDHNCVDGYLKAMCVLDDGHAGDHEFMNQSEITITFTPDAVKVLDALE